MWCKFWSCIKAKLCNRSHSQLDLPVGKNMALPFHLQLLQFQLRGKCVGLGGQLVCFSAVCWCDAVCIAHFLLQMSKVQSSTHKIVSICMNLCVMYFWWPHCVWCELSKQRNAPVSLACCVVYSAGLYLQVQGKLHWSQITGAHCIITQNYAGLIYCVWQ